MITDISKQTMKILQASYDSAEVPTLRKTIRPLQKYLEDGTTQEKCNIVAYMCRTLADFDITNDGDFVLRDKGRKYQLDVSSVMDMSDDESDGDSGIEVTKEIAKKVKLFVAAIQEYFAKKDETPTPTATVSLDALEKRDVLLHVQQSLATTSVEQLAGFVTESVTSIKELKSIDAKLNKTRSRAYVALYLSYTAVEEKLVATMGAKDKEVARQVNDIIEKQYQLFGCGNRNTLSKYIARGEKLHSLVQITNDDVLLCKHVTTWKVDQFNKKQWEQVVSLLKLWAQSVASGELPAQPTEASRGRSKSSAGRMSPPTQPLSRKFKTEKMATD